MTEEDEERSEIFLAHAISLRYRAFPFWRTLDS